MRLATTGSVAVATQFARETDWPRPFIRPLPCADCDPHKVGVAKSICFRTTSSMGIIWKRKVTFGIHQVRLHRRVLQQLMSDQRPTCATICIYSMHVNSIFSCAYSRLISIKQSVYDKNSLQQIWSPHRQTSYVCVHCMHVWYTMQGSWKLSQTKHTMQNCSLLCFKIASAMHLGIPCQKIH